MENRTRKSIASGILLILVGLFFLAYQFRPDLFQWLRIEMDWPLIVIAVGVFLLTPWPVGGRAGNGRCQPQLWAGSAGCSTGRSATGLWENLVIRLGAHTRICRVRHYPVRFARGRKATRIDRGRRLADNHQPVDVCDFWIFPRRPGCVWQILAGLLHLAWANCAGAKSFSKKTAHERERRGKQLSRSKGTVPALDALPPGRCPGQWEACCQDDACQEVDRMQRKAFYQCISCQRRQGHAQVSPSWPAGQ